MKPLSIIQDMLPGMRSLRTRLAAQQMRRQLQLAVKERLAEGRPLNLVIGAGSSETLVGGPGTPFEDWLLTDASLLNVVDAEQWRAFFPPASINKILAEHLFEHLSEEECAVAFAECFRYLETGGKLRIAVPDGNRRDPDYVAEVAPPRDGHKSLFTIETLPPLLERAGFKVTPLEYFDADERFHAHAWDEAEGLIKRSVRFDRQEAFRRGELYYTSLIVDARKI